MARTLDDVLHFFIPELERPAQPPPETALASAQRRIVAVPLGDRDVVRASLVWNLAVEAARRGAGVTLLAPADGDASLLWPEPGAGPLGTELALSFAQTPSDLARAAFDLAGARVAERAHELEIVLVRVPPAWLGKPIDGAPAFERVLLVSSPERRDLLESYALAKRLLAVSPTSRLGLTLHGVRSVAEAERAFARFAGACERHLLRSVVSYGFIVDDLHVYRSIVSRRPLGLAHPHAPAARALGDVARLLVDDLGEAGGD